MINPEVTDGNSDELSTTSIVRLDCLDDSWGIEMTSTITSRSANPETEAEAVFRQNWNDINNGTAPIGLAGIGEIGYLNNISTGDPDLDFQIKEMIGIINNQS